ncbi:MAG: V-type synthase subunit [Clostridiales bacterium]|jgi:V/A-type H+-transporting ATPase subunit D|nr:V-type synthase subunit [Clostridiales bacterium]
MNPNTFATKGNLMLARKSLALSKNGYELMDKKRNVLIREIMELIGTAEGIQAEIDKTFNEAYVLLQCANIEIGIANVEQLSYAVPKEENLNIKSRSIMGVEIPIVQYNAGEDTPPFGFAGASTSLFEAYMAFAQVKELTIRLSVVENTAYRLAANIKKTQKRANALKNITIPKFEELVSFIQNSLEEKEREEFTRLKVVKKRK